MLEKLKSTKVQGFWFFAIASTAALFLEKIGGGEYVAIVTLLSAVFSTANVMQKRNQT